MFFCFLGFFGIGSLVFLVLVFLVFLVLVFLVFLVLVSFFGCVKGRGLL